MIDADTSHKLLASTDTCIHRYIHICAYNTHTVFVYTKRKKVGWLEEEGGRNTGNGIKEAGIKFPFFN